MNTNPTADRVPPTSPRRQRLRLWIWAVAMPLTAIVATECVEQLPLPSAARLVIATTPLIPFVILVRQMLVVVRQGLDELQQRNFFDALAFVPPALIAVAIVADVLKHAGFLPDFQWTTWTLSIAIAGFYGLGAILASHRFS